VVMLRLLFGSDSWERSALHHEASGGASGASSIFRRRFLNRKNQ
jgi:hypothetical protein